MLWRSSVPVKADGLPLVRRIAPLERLFGNYIMKAPENPYIYELISEFLAYVQHRYSRHTYLNYEKTLQRLRQATHGRYANLTPQKIEQFLQDLPLGIKPLGINSVNAYLTAIKSFCRWCEDFHNLPNPSRKVKYLKPVAFNHRVLTPKELQKLLAVARPNTKAVLLFLANTGLRISEFRSLKEECVSPDKRLLHIVGKGNKQRTVPLNKAALEQLPTVLNFTKKYHNYYELFCRLAHKVGIEKFGPHALRHLYATQLAKSVSLCILSKLLGHANILITQTVYVHLGDADLIGQTDTLVLDGGAL